MSADAAPTTATDHEIQRAALVVDIDEFYLINNAWGREVGDALLSEIAVRLEAVIGADSSVRRFGGDEFVVVAPGGRDAARDLGKRIRSLFAQPFITAGLHLYLSATI